jgi:PcfJ-like protein
MNWGAYRVVAIRCAAELAAEAEAMKNCLATYEEACRAGAVAVYSIRERSTGTRIACFAAERIRQGESWELIEVAGKMNSAVDDELARIGHAMVVKLNGGRGGEVPPF